MITEVKKRDGSLEEFRPDKIEAAIAKAIAAVGKKDKGLSAKLAKQVVKEVEKDFAKVMPSVEDIQDIVEEILIKNNLAEVAKAYIIYREEHKEIRDFKTFLGVRDELKLTPNAIRVLMSRYLLRDEEGNIVETPARLFRRVARVVAQADGRYSKGRVKQTEEEFYEMLSNLEFIPNTPTLMNADAPLGQLSACYVLPIEDNLPSIFDGVKNMAMVHQCLTPSTLVMTQQGLVQLGSVTKDDVIESDEGPFLVQALHNNGAQQTYTLRTTHGYEVTGTAKHKILSVSKSGKLIWKKICELTSNDWLALSPGTWRGTNTTLPKFNCVPKKGRNETSFRAHIYPLPTQLTPELSELIGIYIGDGSNHRDGIRFTVSEKEKDLVEHIMDLADKIFSRHVTVSECKHGTCEVGILSLQIKDWLSFLGVLKKTSRHAQIPKMILQSTEENVCAFFRGLFSADGCIRENGHITYTSASLQLIKVMQIALLHLGIPTRHYKNPTTDVYQLTICSKEGFVSFKTKIGFCSTFKKERLAKISGKDVFVGGKTIPHQKVIIREWFKTLGQDEKKSLKPHLVDIMYRSNRELFTQKLVTLQESAMYSQLLADLASLEFFYTKVRDIVKSDVCEVVDLTVPFKHAYLANGFISHNSGGGTGFSFSKIRPRGDIVKTTKGAASGPLSFMRIFDTTTDVMKQGGKRRGANMGLLRCDHPDIIHFITSKLNGGFQNFNISVGVTEEFMHAVIKNAEYDLINPRTKEIVRSLNAREVFELICATAWQTGDPGLIFIDEINEHNPTKELGEIETTNPCGEQPLHAYESCNLGSINLTKMVKNKDVDWTKLKKTIHKAVHFLDNIIDVNKYPLIETEEITKANRRIGLGVMGFAEMLIILGIRYDSQKAVDFAEKLMKFINDEARKASNKLAEERGSFPNIEKSSLKETRNATVTTIAPTGTISIIAGATSGIEPLFAVSYIRNIMGTRLIEVNTSFEKIAREKGFYSKKLMMKIAKTGKITNLMEVPPSIQKLFRTALEISPEWHVKVQAAFQKHCDNAVSKTINLPETASIQDIRRSYLLAYKLHCKGITVYRYGSKKEQVLSFGEHVSAGESFAGGDPCGECLF